MCRSNYYSIALCFGNAYGASTSEVLEHTAARVDRVLQWRLVTVWTYARCAVAACRAYRQTNLQPIFNQTIPSKMGLAAGVLARITSHSVGGQLYETLHTSGKAYQELTPTLQHCLRAIRIIRIIQNAKALLQIVFGLCRPHYIRSVPTPASKIDWLPRLHRRLYGQSEYNSRNKCVDGCRCTGSNHYYRTSACRAATTTP